MFKRKPKSNPKISLQLATFRADRLKELTENVRKAKEELAKYEQACNVPAGTHVWRDAK